MDRRELLAEIKRRLQAVHGERLKGVILYGSVARGDDGPDSDVDILVLLDDPMDLGTDLMRNIRALRAVSNRIARHISANPVSARRYDTYDCPLYRQVHKEGILL
jgi:predicted nucleotidyltransferase